MTNVNHVHIRGFKAIESLDFEAANINLITGPNNSGKTSLLEAVKIGFEPQSVGIFDGNVSKIVNKKNQNRTASISLKYTKEQATLDGSFDSSNPYQNNQEIGVREAKDPERSEAMYITLQNIVEMNEEYPVGRRINSFSTEEYQQVSEKIRDEVMEGISNLSEESLAEAAEDNCILIEVNGDEYPYIYLGQGYDQLREEIVEDVKQQLIPDILSHLSDNMDKIEQRGVIDRGIQNYLVPRFGRGRFVDKEPPTIDGVRFVSSDLKTPDDEDAVRTSNIEEYLVDNEIVENLADFSFDSLVFEDDGNKYDVPYDFVGSGLQTIVSILWELFDEDYKGDILLLEEPENNLHPEYIIHLVDELVRISRERDIQLFITTHDTDFIDAFFSEPIKESNESYLRDDFRLIQLTKPLSRTLDYDRANQKIEELHADLRGGK